MIARNRKYVPDLVKFGATCEANYRRLLDLLPEDDNLTEFGLYAGENRLGVISVKLLERFKYTDTLLLEQAQSTGKWINNPQFTVRLYHDARLAEVISYYRHRRIEGVNPYPNRFMHHPDEKMQLNLFLAEWLVFCLQYGHVTFPVFNPSRDSPL